MRRNKNYQEPIGVALIVNGERMVTNAPSLASLLAEVGHGSSLVATALNGQFVPASKREKTTLAEGDRIDIVAPRQGG